MGGFCDWSPSLISLHPHSFTKLVQFPRGNLPLPLPLPKFKTFGYVLGCLNGAESLAQESLGCESIGLLLA